MKVTILALLLTLLPLSTTTVVEARTGEQNCLALNIYYEARGSSQLDMKAVGSVTVNRVKSKYFSKKSVCSVVYQPGQFSWTTDKYPNIPTDQKQWKLSLKIADTIISGEQEDVTSGATYFYDHSRVRPTWARKMTMTLKTQNHSYMKLT